jgi:hypothetical protein
MLSKAQSLGRCRQENLTSAALRKITGLDGAQVGRLTSIAVQRKTTAGQAIDVEVALSVIALARSSQLSFEVNELACAYGPLIRASLTHLASDLANWKIDGSPEKATPFLELFDDEHGAGLRRRGIQELLGFPGSHISRYLVKRPAMPWSVNDNLDALISEGKEPVAAMLDALALADAFSHAVAGPLFKWEP